MNKCQGHQHNHEEGASREHIPLPMSSAPRCASRIFPTEPPKVEKNKKIRQQEKKEERKKKEKKEVRNKKGKKEKRKKEN